MADNISRERVLAIIAAYGGNPERWPEEERSGALKLVEADPALAEKLAPERELDRWLEEVRAPAPAPDLRARVLAAAQGPQSLDLVARFLGWLFPGEVEAPVWLWRTALTAVLPLTLGFLVGIGTASNSTAEPWDSWEDEIYITGIVSLDSEAEQLYPQADQEEEVN